MNRHRQVAISIFVAVMLSGSALSAAAQNLTVPPWRTEFPAARAAAEMKVGETTVPVELALAPAEQQLGLGYRNELKPGTGMLFPFPEASEQSFWMKGMRFCLDIIWIEQGEIKGAAERACPDPPGTSDADRARFRSGEPVSYVLEMPAGWMASNGYTVGTPVMIPDELS